VSSGGQAKDAIEWIRNLNRYVRRPDLTIVLDVSPETAAERRLFRAETAQLYDQNEVQRALAAFYRDLAKHLPKDRIEVIDASGPIDDVHERVWRVYEKAFG
jgi:dTMP kinase